MEKRWGMAVALVLVGCNSQDRIIDDSLARMQAEIVDGTQVAVDRSSVSMHYREKFRAICGVANVIPRTSDKSEQQHFIVFVRKLDYPVMFSFDSGGSQENRDVFNNLWNTNCVGD